MQEIVLATIFGIIAVMLVRAREVSFLSALAIGLAGFYLALTPVGWALITPIEWFIEKLT